LQATSQTITSQVREAAEAATAVFHSTSGEVLSALNQSTEASAMALRDTSETVAARRCFPGRNLCLP